MASARFRSLERRVGKLRKHLLPARFSVTGAYTPAQLDKARGFRLLVHAEIEHYFEERAERLIQVCVDGWKVDRKPRDVVISLLSIHLELEASKERYKKNHGKIDQVECAVEMANAAYRYLLKKNNGIKEENVLAILMPLGVKESQLDQTWLNTLSSFGTLRGETAHSSVKVQQPVDPKTELDTVDQILDGVEKVDALLNHIKV